MIIFSILIKVNPSFEWRGTFYGAGRGNGVRGKRRGKREVTPRGRIGTVGNGGKQTGEAGWMQMAGSEIDADRGICLCRIRARHGLEKRVESSGGVRPKPEMWECSNAWGERGRRGTMTGYRCQWIVGAGAHRAEKGCSRGFIRGIGWRRTPASIHTPVFRGAEDWRIRHRYGSTGRSLGG